MEVDIKPMSFMNMSHILGTNEQCKNDTVCRIISPYIKWKSNNLVGSVKVIFLITYHVTLEEHMFEHTII